MTTETIIARWARGESLLPLIEAALAAARREALEEAAMVCMTTWWRVGGQNVQLDDLIAAIRALKERE